MLLLVAGSSAWAQDPSGSPSPQDPSPAYPLNPGETPPTATASPQLDDEASATPAASRGDDGGVPPALPIGLAALLAAGAGLGLVALRRRERPAEPAAVAAAAESPPPKRFQWRDYPEPARPAPPPPPVPGAKSPKFEVGLEEERSSSPPRAKQREAR